MTVKDIETERKRLIFRSWHRGTREMDLIMGSFADRYLPEFSEIQLSQYDEIIQYPDPDLYNWITGQELVPANFINPVFNLLLSHRFAS